jgi:hypothetical protein
MDALANHLSADGMGVCFFSIIRELSNVNLKPLMYELA